MKILVTGASGMIGSRLVSALLDSGYEVICVDLRENPDKRSINYVMDLSDSVALKKLVFDNQVDRIIHLAALAHANNQIELTYESFYQANVECAKNIFAAACDIPILFISTVDVYGFTRGKVNTTDAVAPVSDYGKTKAIAESECKRLCKNYNIFRFSPVYTETVKRDIQKRYYLKYPSIAYLIGKGTEYEVLDVNVAVDEMIKWCASECDNTIRIIKDTKNMYTPDCIKEEKTQGRARFVLHIPRWLVVCGYKILVAFTGKNKYTYLLNKAVNPLKSE